LKYWISSKDKDHFILYIKQLNILRPFCLIWDYLCNPTFQTAKYESFPRTKAIDLFLFGLFQRSPNGQSFSHKNR